MPSHLFNLDDPCLEYLNTNIYDNLNMLFVTFTHKSKTVLVDGVTMLKNVFNGNTVGLFNRVDAKHTNVRHCAHSLTYVRVILKNYMNKAIRQWHKFDLISYVFRVLLILYMFFHIIITMINTCEQLFTIIIKSTLSMKFNILLLSKLPSTNRTEQ
jgi:hypothetical protein